jgi:hypothetical protein
MEAFLSALESEYQIEKEENGSIKITSVALGSELEIPSLKDFVFDNNLPYEELTLTVYYSSSASESTTKNMKFNLNEVGKYEFYVAFEDADGNKMVKDDFKTVDGQTVTYGKYGDDAQDGLFIFSFNINDNAEIEIEAAVEQGVGYKNITYTASKFTIDAVGCKLEYKLYYNADVNATKDSSGWKEIPKATSDMKKDYVSESGYTYSQIKEIAYDGNLSFKPTELGAYKIECTATSEVSPRTATASTLIKVTSEPTVVKVDNHWLQNNIWSVVFLSIGSLCLVGIIVLLFIKPKEDIDE